jgi:hypothetical protein
MAYGSGYSGGYQDGEGASALTTSVAGTLGIAINIAGSSAYASTVAATQTLGIGLAASVAFSTGVSGTGFTTAASVAGSSAARLTTGYVDLTQHFTFAVEGRSAAVMGAAGTAGATWAAESRSLLHFTAGATAIPDPTFTFLPPTRNDTPGVLTTTHGPQRRLFRYYGGNPRGLSVVSSAGHYATVDNPSADLLVDGGEGRTWFLGGHVYVIDKAIAASLSADGFGSYFGPTPTHTWGALNPYAWQVESTRSWGTI